MFTTPTTTHAKIAAFLRWFDAEIGTETEIDEVSVGMWSATCFELEDNEAKRCAAWWQNNG